MQGPRQSEVLSGWLICLWVRPALYTLITSIVRERASQVLQKTNYRLNTARETLDLVIDEFLINVFSSNIRFNVRFDEDWMNESV